MTSEDNARAKLRKDAQKRVPARPEHPSLGRPIIGAYEKLDQVVEPSYQHFAPPSKTLASTVVEAVIGLAVPDHPDEWVGNLSDEAAVILQFRQSLQSKFA